MENWGESSKSSSSFGEYEYESREIPDIRDRAYKELLDTSSSSSSLDFDKTFEDICEKLQQQSVPDNPLFKGLGNKFPSDKSDESEDNEEEEEDDYVDANDTAEDAESKMDTASCDKVVLGSSEAQINDYPQDVEMTQPLIQDLGTSTSSLANVKNSNEEDGHTSQLFAALYKCSPPPKPAALEIQHPPTSHPLETYEHFLKKDLEYDILSEFYLDLAKHGIGGTLNASYVIERLHSFAEVMYGKCKADDSSATSYNVLTISPANIPQDPTIQKVLGYQISYIGECPHTQAADQKCQLMCPQCGVCSHMYRCSCPFDKYKYQQWCIHMHAAVQGGKNAFKSDLVSFCHVTTRKMRLAHVKGLTYGELNVDKESGTKYLVKSAGDLGSGTGPQYRVKKRRQTLLGCRVCPSYKKCKACGICRHNYQCTCDEYTRQKLVCEHCHAVAIHSYKRGFLKKASNEDPKWLLAQQIEQEDASDLTNEDSDEPNEDEQSMARLRRRIIAAHHERGMLIKGDRVRILCDEVGYKRRIVANSTGTKEYMVELRYESCFLHRGKECSNFCMDCRTCEYRYTCTCGKPSEQICKHIHRVAKDLHVKKFDRSDIDEAPNSPSELPVDG